MEYYPELDIDYQPETVRDTSENRISSALRSHGYHHYADLVNEIIEDNVILKEINEKLMKSL